MNELINKQLCGKSAQYKCRANYKYIQGTNKTNTSQKLLVSCLHIHQAYNMWDVEHTFYLIYPDYKLLCNYYVIL